MKFYRESAESVASYFATQLTTGLTTQQTNERQKIYGLNKIPETKAPSLLIIFFKQFKSPLIYLLLVAAAIIFFIGQAIDAYIISCILLFNAIIGALQEARTNKLLTLLSQFTQHKTIALRNGNIDAIDSNDLVPGDIVLLEAGMKIPADARIIECTHLALDEALITGESEPVVKQAIAIDHEARVHDRYNMVFQGTFVMQGHGRAIITATGKNTELGFIASTSLTKDKDFLLKQEIARLSKLIVFFVLLFCIALFGIGLLQHRPFQELLTILTALFICVVPEGLPIILTLVFVRGTYNMAKKNVLVKKLQAMETLAQVDTIILDKTGTLTRNEMMVTQIVCDHQLFTCTGQGYKEQGDIYPIEKKDNIKLQRIAQAAILLNRAIIKAVPNSNNFEVLGEPTEAALSVVAKKILDHYSTIHTQYKLKFEIPFDTTMQYHAGFFEHNQQAVLFIIGSPEKIISHVKTLPTDTEKYLDRFLQEGLRVVAVAEKIIPLEEIHQLTTTNAIDHVTDLTFLGICAIEDAIRPYAQESIIQAQAHGLSVIMATGDHAKTALHIARACGISHTDQALQGAEFAQMNKQQRYEAIQDYKVFARFSPQEKLELITLLQQAEHSVAMTGDGINDVPSIIAADVGIVMATMGTEIAKEAADIVIIDDSFFSIVYAIKQGRHIFYTLRRIILYFFATNFGEILVITYALVMGLPAPLLAAQIVWLNLITDGFLDMALAMEPEDNVLLEKKWKKTNKLIDKKLLFKVFYMAIPMGIGSIIIFYTAITTIEKARTMCLLTMAMFQWFNAWNCRSEYKSIFQLGLFKNKWLILATTVVILLQSAVIYIPHLQLIFKTVSLSLIDWLMACITASSIFIIEECKKICMQCYHAWRFDALREKN